eukprot:scaffold855_cov274-Chaetoceros_neogracile.AAC.4
MPGVNWEAAGYKPPPEPSSWKIDLSTKDLPETSSNQCKSYYLVGWCQEGKHHPSQIIFVGSKAGVEHQSHRILQQHDIGATFSSFPIASMPIGIIRIRTFGYSFFQIL